VEPADVASRLVIRVKLEERPRDVGTLRLNVAWVFEQVTEPEEMLPLHDTHEFGEIARART